MKVTAAIVDGRRINIVCEGARSVTGIDVMTPEEAVLLARSLLSCAVAASAENCPPANTRISDAHLPLTRWTTAISPVTGVAALIVRIQDVPLNFIIPRDAVRAFGESLITLADRVQAAEGPTILQ